MKKNIAIYYILSFICFGIDMSSNLYYSFYIISIFFGRYIFLDHKTVKELSFLECLFGFIVFPIIFGILFRWLF